MRAGRAAATLARRALKAGACAAALALGTFNWAPARLPGQAAPATPDPAATLPPRTREFDLRSRTTGQVYRIYVALPHASAPAPHGYRVLYVLDGNTLFAPAVQAARADPGAAHALVVVGIGYPASPALDNRRRYEDFTPATWPGRIKNWLRLPQAYRAGGQDAFYGFIEDQVKGAVEQLAPIDRTQQALFAHSLGGLFALYVLFRHPGAFQTYIAASPSIWWHGRSILAEQKRFEGAPRQGAAPRLMLTVGGAEQAARPAGAGPASSARFDSRMVDNAAEMAARLKTLMPVEFRIYPGGTHMSYLPAALHAAVAFADAGARVARR